MGPGLATLEAVLVAVPLGIVSVSEDALQSAGRELREGSYALGATRPEIVRHQSTE